jgi:hypothetical protein
MSNSTSKIDKSLLSRPDDFSGTKGTITFRQWWRQIHVMFEAESKTLSDDKKKVLFALSFMKSGNSGLWADNYVDEQDAMPSNQRYVFADFEAAIKSAFDDANARREAQRHLELLKQGSMTAEEFFVQFDQLARTAGWAAGSDDHLNLLLERALNSRLVDRIWESTDTIKAATYAAWKAKAIEQDQLYRQREARRQRTHAPPPPPPPRTTPAQPRSSVSQQPSTSETGTFSGQGLPMDVDACRRRGLCFKCQKYGHLAKDCLQGKPAEVRAVLESLTEDEKGEMKQWLGEKGF